MPASQPSCLNAPRMEGDLLGEHTACMSHCKHLTHTKVWHTLRPCGKNTTTVAPWHTQHVESHACSHQCHQCYVHHCRVLAKNQMGIAWVLPPLLLLPWRRRKQLQVVVVVARLLLLLLLSPLLKKPPLLLLVVTTVMQLQQLLSVPAFEHLELLVSPTTSWQIFVWVVYWICLGQLYHFYTARRR